MGAQEHILVVVDPTSEVQPAVERAVWLGQKLGARLELFACDYDQFVLSEQSYDSVALSKAKQRLLDGNIERLRALAEPVRARGITVSVDARWHDPLDQGIVRKVRDAKPSLVVKDTRYQPPLKRSIFSNTDWNLIRDCPVPLLLVKQRPITGRPCILAAVDPFHSCDKSAESDHRILSVATDTSAAVEGDLHVFHAFDPAPAIAAAVDTIATPLAAPVSTLTEALKLRHRRALDALLNEFSLSNTDKLHLHQGVPQELLVALAEQLKADMVIMGAASRSATKPNFVGSTAERVLDKLPCDVLVVKNETTVDFVAEDREARLQI